LLYLLYVIVIDTSVLFSGGSAFPQLVPSCAQGAGFLALAIFMPVVKLTALDAPHCN